MASPVWLITGVSSGFGLSLALRALDARHRVIGTVRSKTKAADDVRRIVDQGEQVLELDMVDSQATIAARVAEAEAIYGRIDYLVNNAGSSILGALQHFTEAEVKMQFQTNVFGPIFTTQAVLAGMRSRKGGLVVNISSVGGQDAVIACSLYGSSKFALEGMSEALAKEVNEFGISVLLVEPGAYRTNFLSAAQHPATGVPDDYASTALEAALHNFVNLTGKQPGDPDLAVQRIFQVITGEGDAGHLHGKVLRLPLGMDAIQRIERKTMKLQDDLAEARKLEEQSSTAFIRG